MEVRSLFLSLFFYLAAGTFVSLGWLRPPALGRKYLLFHGLVAVFFSLLALIAISDSTPLTVQWGLVIFSVAVSGFLITMRRFPGFSSSCFLTAFIAIMMIIYFDIEGHFATWTVSIYPMTSFLTNALLSVTLLGSTFGVLLFSHQLSPDRNAHAKEFKKLIILFTALVLARFGFSAYFFLHAFNFQNGLETYRYFLTASPGLFLLVRWGWGILAPLLLTYLVWWVFRRMPETRSQSMFYILMLFVLTGETLSLYLALFHHLPV